MPKGSWLVLTDGPDSAAAEFAVGFLSPKRRVITADLNDESEVQNAFADFAGDPAMPRRAWSSAADRPNGADLEAGLAHARELIWSLAAAARTITGGWHGKSPRLWLVSRGGLCGGHRW